MGWGLKAGEYIEKGSYITQYVGEVIKEEDARARQERGSKFLLEMDFFDKETFNLDDWFSMDAQFFGNESRFINHSCDPNVDIYCVWTDNYHPKFPKIAFFANKPIKKNEEICFDYKMKCNSIPDFFLFFIQHQT